MKKNKKTPKSINDYTFIIFDIRYKEFKGTREKAGFDTQEEAQEYIEDHERPNDLICIIKPAFTESYLDKLRELRLEKDDIQILQLFELGNYPKAIEKILNKNIDTACHRLSKNKFIEGAYSEIKITQRGIDFLNNQVRI